MSAKEFGCLQARQVALLVIEVPNLGLEFLDSEILDFFNGKNPKFESPKFQVPNTGPLLQALRLSQGCFPVVPKLFQSYQGVWLFASKADCLKGVSKMFRSYPKAIRAQGFVVCKQDRLS